MNFVQLKRIDGEVICIATAHIVSLQPYANDKEITWVITTAGKFPVKGYMSHIVRELA